MALVVTPEYQPGDLRNACALCASSKRGDEVIFRSDLPTPDDDTIAICEQCIREAAGTLGFVTATDYSRFATAGAKGRAVGEAVLDVLAALSSFDAAAKADEIRSVLDTPESVFGEAAAVQVDEVTAQHTRELEKARARERALQARIDELEVDAATEPDRDEAPVDTSRSDLLREAYEGRVTELEAQLAAAIEENADLVAALVELKPEFAEPGDDDDVLEAKDSDGGTGEGEPTTNTEAVTGEPPAEVVTARPKDSANKPEWVAYASSLGIEDDKLSKEQLIEACDALVRLNSTPSDIA